MKPLKILFAVLFLFFSVSALADDVTACRYGRGSTVFLLDCLNTTFGPAYVDRMKTKTKTVQCHQNAKNKNLRGVYKQGYIDACMNRNDAYVVFDKVNPA
jgi:hypothetical protein